MKYGMKSHFIVPLNIGRFPVIALMGLVISVLLILQFEPMVYALEAAIVVLGLIAFRLVRFEKKNGFHMRSH